MSFRNSTGTFDKFHHYLHFLQITRPLIIASHKSNPRDRNSGYVEIRTLGHVGAVTGVEENPIEGYYETRWLTRLWNSYVKVEGIVPKAVRH
jgi:hypothetical protein